MRPRAAVAALLVALAGPLSLGACATPGANDDRPALRVEVTIHHSRFQPAVITVPVRRAVTITLRNEDPIDHEWIVGSESVHEAHRNGTETEHESRPTEVTIPALSTRETTVVFERAGRLAFICHLPGHEAYGMVGALNVV